MNRPRSKIAGPFLIAFLVAALIIAFFPVGARADGACQVSVSAFEPVGASPNGALTAFQFVLRANTESPFSARLTLHATTNTGYAVDIASVSPEKPDYVTTFRFVFDAEPIHDIHLDSLTYRGQTTPIACSGEGVPPGPETDLSNIAIFPNPAGAVRRIVLPIVAEPYTVVDAKFRYIAKARYPELAKNLGEQGTVVIYVTVGPDGKLVDAQVSQSSFYPDLDLAALDAAKASTYSPPTVAGKPAALTYRVIYKFSLADGEGLRPETNCEVQLGSATLLGHSDALNLDYYSFSASGTSPNIASADLGLSVHRQSAITVRWLDLAKAPRTTAGWSDTFRFVWRGPAIQGAWITNYYRNDDDPKGTSCQSQPLNVLPGAGVRLLEPPSQRQAPQSSIFMERVYPADFIRREIPAYPHDASAVFPSGIVGVLVSVDPTGKPLGADRLWGSRNAILGKSAIAAAMTSRYRLHTRKNGTVDSYVYSVAYHFVAQPPWEDTQQRSEPRP